MVELTNGFGITKQFKIRGASTGRDILDYGACQRATILLRLAPATIICLPVWDFTLAEKTAGSTVRVTLTNGTYVEGVPFGSLVSDDGESNGLAGMQKLRIVDVKEGYPRNNTGGTDQTLMKGSAASWELSTGNTPSSKFAIRDATFAIRYYSSAGYVLGGSDTAELTASFFLTKGTDELEAPISDFSQVSITKTGNAQRISVTAPNGTVTTGTLALKGKDSKGTHEASEWMFGGILQGTTLSRVMTSSPSTTLRRK
jgi:hypothetical protein